jgi:hypothetical protein
MGVIMEVGVVQRPRQRIATASTLTLAAVCWVVSAHEMSGMDTGPASQLGSFGFFALVWVAMMAAMMLPSTAPAVWKRSATAGVPSFLAAYLAVWIVVGMAVYVIYRSHTTAVAGALVVAAGAYELTPLKRRCRERCRQVAVSGSSLDGCVSAPAMVGAQKVLVPRPSVDVPAGLAIVGAGDHHRGRSLIDPWPHAIDVRAVWQSRGRQVGADTKGSRIG